MASLKAFISTVNTNMGNVATYIKNITGLASETTAPDVNLKDTATALMAITGKFSPTTSPDVSLSTVNSHINASNPHSGTQAALGYTPIQQGGGVGQSGVKLYIGWDNSSNLKLSVGTSDIGNFAMQDWVSGSYAPKNAASFTGFTNFSGQVAFYNNLGFFGEYPISKRTINGTVASSVPNTNGSSLGALLDALSAYGLITDNTIRT
ncbi:MAG: hypothetical protein WC856_02415 [Methylococcaceae bacterium]|jgi:hypothetical protein